MPETFQSPRDWIRSMERLRNSDTVGSLVRPLDLSRGDMESIRKGSKEDMQRMSQSLMSPLWSHSKSSTPRTPRLSMALATNPRQLNYDLTTDKPCISARASQNYTRKAALRKADVDPPAGDKPCVSLPGESTTAWRRDPEVYLEYSDQYASHRRPGKGERLKTAADRAELPHRLAKINGKEDGAYAKPLVGYRDYQGQQRGAACQELGRTPTGVSIRPGQLRSSYKEFRGTEPVVLNRTVGYDGGSLQQSEHEPHGVIKTDITDYNLEKWVDPYPHVVTPRIDTAMRKERGETLKILKALKGPPNFGKSMVPKISVPDDMVMELIERPPISQRHPVVTPDARPCNIRDGKQELLFSSLHARRSINTSPTLPHQNTLKPLKAQELVASCPECGKSTLNKLKKRELTERTAGLVRKILES